MTALISQDRIGEVPWLIASGERQEVFRALGEHARAAIAELLPELSERGGLRPRAAAGGGHHVRLVVEASRRTFPSEWAELEALAEGAGVDVDDLALLTLRGDLLPVEAEGCSDFGWSDGERAVLGHNEDGDSVLDGRCFLLTLRVEGEPAMVTWWYPGFLPGNTYSVNEHGLVFGVDAIAPRVVEPAPGRAFVARRLQGCGSVEDAVELVRAHPVAGGFAYVMGRLGDAGIVTVEQSGSGFACRPLEAAAACTWHTNHLRLLPSCLDAPGPSSRRREEILEAVRPPATGASADWVLDLLTGAPVPEGVRAEGAVVTLCTLVTDLCLGTVTIRQRGALPVTVALADLVQGALSRC